MANEYGRYPSYDYDYCLDHPKTCPLTGRKLTVGIDDACYFRYDCNNVDGSPIGTTYGKKFRCGLEKDNIELWYKKELEKKARCIMHNESLETARKIDLEGFYEYCNELDEEMINSRQAYGKDMALCPYHEPQNSCIIYLFKNDELKEIAVSGSPLSFIGKRIEGKNADGNIKYAVSYQEVPEYLAEAISVNQHLKRHWDVKSILHDNNPVYIKSRHAGQYVYDVYGLHQSTFAKLRRENLDLTEISNFENVIMIKQEIDKAVKAYIETHEKIH